MTETQTGEKKKKKGVKGMLSKLTKARSIEDSCTGGSIVGAGVKAMGVGVGGSGSDLSLDVEKEGKVRGKIKSFFKGTSGNRTQSTDRGSTGREGPSVKTVAGNIDSDTAAAGSLTSLDSEVSITLPLSSLRRRRVRGELTKAQSTSAIARQGSFETEV
ncbi:hypothetical protein Pmani_018037 [Petrolisthes manimaculis]|uniref:Uncharacterized protein n=1 Tax=Petrolisthes manimaculis TaxID=1843537 RepID=A0AAE1U737_9EUCA|nr:hypothetical protein Pmani_018037 [Petrolisthes manimaculis]